MRIPLLAAFALLATTALSQTAPPGKMLIVEPIHHAGRVDRGTIVEHAFVIKNVGAGDLTIDAKPGCGCTVVDFDKVIPPGATGAVRAKLDTRAFKGDLSKSVTLDTNDPDQRQALLQLTVNVYVPLDIQPSDVLAVEGRRGEVKPVELTVGSTDNVPFDILAAESNDPSYSVRVVAAPAEGKKVVTKSRKDAVASGASRYVVTVNVAKDVPPGHGGVQIKLRTTLAKAPEALIQLFPNITGDLSVTPDRLTLRLSPTAPADARTQHVSVKSEPGVTFHVTSVTSSNPLLKADFKAVSEGAEYDIAVTYDGPPLANVVDGHVSILTDHPDQPVLPVAVYAFPDPLPASVTGAGK